MKTEMFLNSLFRTLLAWILAWIFPLMQIYSFFVARAGFYLKGDQKVVLIKSRKFEIMRHIGEGGYSIVYLAKEADPTPNENTSNDNIYAVKKIIATGRERLKLVRKEIEIHSAVSMHPSILPLLGHDIIASGPANAGAPIQSDTSTSSDHLTIDVLDSEVKYTAYLVFPAHTDGTLAEEVERLERSEIKMGLSTSQVLGIFIQVCDALSFIHEKGFAHRDVKPHNVLIKRPKSMPLHCGLEGSFKKDEGVQVSNEAQYKAVLMDFGSAMPRLATPLTRQQALDLQEDAAAHCTATYRAPELFDVPTGLTIDLARSDVWSAGCLLFAAMYGVSPFQYAADQPGGSIALAIINCSVPWPKSGKPSYPELIHDLVRACLVLDPGKRPSALQLRDRAMSILASIQ